MAAAKIGVKGAMGFVRALFGWAGRLGPCLLGLAGCAGPADSGLTLENTEGNLTRADWCDARAVILEKCVRCHSAPPRNGAPFSLATYADTQVPSPNGDAPERTRADRMLHAVETGIMPFTGFILDPPVAKLTCEERETLLDWLRNGAQAPAAGDEECKNARTRRLECSDGTAGAGGESG